MSKRLILGPPGTGKTTTLLQLVERELQQGVPPDRIAFLTFTRAAAQEAVERAVAQFNYTREEFVYFRTLHSLAYHLLGIQRKEVMQATDWQAFGDDHSYSFKLPVLDERPAFGGDLGDQLARCYSLARARATSIEQEWKRGDYSVPEWAVTRFAQQLRTHKAEHGLLDFADFLDTLDARLDVDILIVDEAQDLTKQQWRVINMLARDVPRIVVAGDDDQAIFEWAGADVRGFLDLGYSRTVLPLSHRLPRKVKAFADAVISPVKDRYAKEWSARNEEGSLDVIGGRSVEIDREGSWLLLARTNAQLRMLEAFAKESGRVYSINGKWSHDTPSGRAILGWTRLSRGTPVSKAHWDAVARFSGRTLRGPVGREVAPGDVSGPSLEGVPWFEGLRELGAYEVAYFRSVLRRGERLDAPGSVRVATVHSSKGLEADWVLLLGRQGNKDRSDAERRTWYVGATRARQGMLVVDSGANPLLPRE